MNRRDMAWQGCADSEFVARVAEALKLLELAPEVERDDSGTSTVAVGFVEGWRLAHDVWRLAHLIDRARLPKFPWYEHQEFERLIDRFTGELIDVLAPDA